MSLTIYPTPYNRIKNVLSVSLNKIFPSFLHYRRQVAMDCEVAQPRSVHRPLFRSLLVSVQAAGHHFDPGRDLQVHPPNVRHHHLPCRVSTRGHPSAYHSTLQTTGLFVCLFICLFVYLFIYLFVYLFMYVCV